MSRMECARVGAILVNKNPHIFPIDSATNWRITHEGDNLTGAGENGCAAVTDAFRQLC